MTRSIFGLVLAMAAAAGCRCPDAYFGKDQTFEVTVVQQNASSTTCNAASPSLMAGDKLNLVGTGDQSFEAGMCDDGSLVPNETPSFATDVLTTCSQGTYSCSGQTAAGCAVRADVRAGRDKSMSPDGGTARGTFSIRWNSACDPAFNCEERYDVTFRPVGS